MSFTPAPQRKALVIGCGIAGPVVALALRCVGIDVTVYEARSESADAAGSFLNLAPNGVNALRTLDLAHLLDADGFPSLGMRFFNSAGTQIGALDSRNERERYGAHNMMITRARLHRALHHEATQQGISIEWGKKLTGITVTTTGTVIAQFADGTTATGDYLLGCDGLHSRTRQLILPGAPHPTYTGIVDCGAITRPPIALPAANVMHMVFGKRAFFSYLVREQGEVWWFSNVAWPTEPARGELHILSNAAWKERLLTQHRDDPVPISHIIHATTESLGKWPIYDMPPLPTWHKGPVCLLGDAAHAISPHAGQGAALALEDAVVLAHCLSTISNTEQAFAAFQHLRKARVEQVVAAARSIGNRKVPHPLMARFRDLMLPFFLKMGTAQTARLYRYKPPWNEHVGAEVRHG